MSDINPRYTSQLECPSESRQSNCFGALQERRDATIWHNSISTKKWPILLFGQAIALGAASMNAASYTLEYNLGVIVPIFLMCVTYLLLSIHLLYMRREQRINEDERAHKLPLSNLRLHVPWWIYLGMAIMDVVPNYMTLASFRYTSLTSTTLLSSLTVPATMLASRYILARTYQLSHFLGVCLSLLGGAMTVWMDVGNETSTDTNHPYSYIGDLLAIAAAILYGVSDAIGEYSIKYIDRVEYLGMLGFFGAILTFLSLPLLEGRAVYLLFADTPASILCAVFAVMVWYVISLMYYYIASTVFYTRGDATLLNLSLQTSNMWAILFTVVAERESPKKEFYWATIMVATGVFIYEMGPKIRCEAALATPESHGSPQENEPFNVAERQRIKESIKMEEI